MSGLSRFFKNSIQSLTGAPTAASERRETAVETTAAQQAAAPAPTVLPTMAPPVMAPELPAPPPPVMPSAPILEPKPVAKAPDESTLQVQARQRTAALTAARAGRSSTILSRPTSAAGGDYSGRKLG